MSESERGTAIRSESSASDGRTSRVGAFLRELGPGLITGAADDDPSGIGTYSQAGAAFGYGLLWTALLSFPLMIAVQLMCARLAVVSGRGLGSVLRRHYSPVLLWGACLLLIVGNTINIAADLGAMGATVALLTGLPALWLIPLFTAVIVAMLVFASYARMSSILKWLSVALFAYVGSAFLAHPDWRRVAAGTFLPHVVWSRDYLLTFVAIFGTTISPYLFFWQASQSVEQQKAIAHDIGGRAPRATERELRGTRRDVVTGMLVSNVIMYFIIVTAGATLHEAGKTTIQSASEAASALAPIAGQWAAWLFSAGIVGTGLLGVPVLAGSTAYALAEAAAWRRGMDEPAMSARKFYGVIVVSMLVGMALNFLHLDAIKLLVWSAVVNGILAPPLIILVLVVCNNRTIMAEHTNGRGLNIAGGFAALLMTAAALGLVGSWFH